MALTLSDHLQDEIDAILAAIEHDRAVRKKRYDAEYEKAQRAAEEEQKRYDAEYRKARLAAMVRQETRDIRSADDERAADKQNQEIASVRHEAAQAWSDHLVVEQRFAVCRDAPTRAEPLGISGVPARWPRRSAHGGSRTPANIARSHGPCEPQRDP